MFKKGVKSYQFNRGTNFARTNRGLFIIPFALAVCAALIIYMPHVLSHPTSGPEHTEIAKALVTNTGNLKDQKDTAAPATSPVARTSDTSSSHAPSSSSTVPDTSQPSSAPASQPATDCKTLIKNLSDNLASIKAATATLLTHNLDMVGLDLGLQNNFIDGYNKTIQQAYASSLQNAKDAGCTMTVTAPAPMAHKKLL